MTINNTRMRVLLWKYKIDLIMPEIGEDKGYGELQLISEILNDKALLSKAPDLDECLNQLKRRVSKENICVILEIISRVTIVTSNKFVIKLVDHIINGSKDSDINYEMLALKEKHYFMVTCINLIKENKIPMLMKRLSECYLIESLYMNIKELNASHTDFFIKNFMNNRNFRITSSNKNSSRQNEGGSESGESSLEDNEGNSENDPENDTESEESSSNNSEPRVINDIDEYIIDIKFSYRNQYLGFFNAQYQILFTFYFQLHFTKVIAKRTLIANLEEFIHKFLKNRFFKVDIHDAENREISSRDFEEEILSLELWSFTHINQNLTMFLQFNESLQETLD